LDGVILDVIPYIDIFIIDILYFIFYFDNNDNNNDNDDDDDDCAYG